MKSQKNRVHVCRNVRRNEDEERKEERKDNVEMDPVLHEVSTPDVYLT